MASEQAVILKMNEGHIRGILALDEKITGVQRSPSWKQRVHRYLEAFYPPVCHVAELDGQVVGFILGDIRGWEYGLTAAAWVDIMGVDPAHQRCGIGKRLVEAFVRESRASGFKSIHVMVREDDDRLQPFLRSAGFMRGKLVDYELPVMPEDLKVLPQVHLTAVLREDVQRIARWLEDEEVSSLWLGRYPDGTPVHLGYVPQEALKTSKEAWDQVFGDPHRNIFSIRTAAGEHIGEAHLTVEWPLRSAEVAVLIGRKDYWGKGYGTGTMKELLRLAFEVHDLDRVWADVPEFNTAAYHMCRRLGFIEEGRLRKSRPRGGQRFDSIVMGILKGEYRPE